MNHFYTLIFFLFLLQVSFPNFGNEFLELEKVFNCTNCSISFSPLYTIAFNGLIYVLDTKNIIYVLNNNDSLEFSIGRGQYYDFLQEPISFATDGNLIYILDRDKRKIFYFVSPSDYDYIDFQFQEQVPVFSPSVVVDNKIWFLNKQNNFILSLNFSSKNFETYLSKGIGDGKINEPLDFTFANDYFIIADTKNKRVELFDKNLNFVSNIGLGPEILLEYPNAIAADQDFIYVSDLSLQSLLIFDYNGYFIKRISYSELNISEISDIFLNSSHLFLTSQKNKKILLFKIDKNKINYGLYERLNAINQNIDLLSNNYSILFNYVSPSFSEEFRLLTQEFFTLKTLFEERRFIELEKKLSVLEQKFNTFNQTFYKELDLSLNNSLNVLLGKLKNVSDGNLVLILKDYIDTSFSILEKKDYIGVVQNIELIEEKLANHFRSKELEKEIVKEKIINENFSINPKEESLKEQYNSFYEKIMKKRQDVILQANELNYSLNLFILDQYLTAADLAKKNSEYNNSLNYLFEADNYLNSIYEKMLEYKQTVEILDEYKKNISLIINDSSNSIAMLKLSKAYLIAQSNSSLAIEEAKKAMELAQSETQFISLFPSPRVYAIFLFLFILASIIIIGLIIFGLLKSSLEKRRKKDSELFIIKKAKRI